MSVPRYDQKALQQRHRMAARTQSYLYYTARNKLIEHGAHEKHGVGEVELSYDPWNRRGTSTNYMYMYKIYE